MKLKYQVEGHGKIEAEVKSVADAQAFLRDHQLGKIMPFSEGFGASELLSTPTVTDGDRVVAKLNYNGSIQ
jgi:Holliday junction resolvase